MSYVNESRQIWITPDSVTDDDLSATGDAAEVFRVGGRAITVLRVGCVITTVLSGAATVKFDRRVLAGSDTGRGDGDVDSIVIPTTTAAGKVVYSDCTPIDLDPGDEIVPQVTSAASSGAGYYFIEYLVKPEGAGNISDMVASA